jgi:hypothetical protein
MTLTSVVGAAPIRAPAFRFMNAAWNAFHSGGAALFFGLVFALVVLAGCGGGGADAGGGGGGGGGTPTTWTISGTISPASLGAGATVTLSGAASATTTADASGNYSFTGHSNGAYTVTPTKASTTFAPANAQVTINGANVTAVNFTAAANPAPTFTASGAISPSSLGSGATVTLTGATGATVTANASGAFSFTGLANGAYTITPTKASTTFAPANAQITVNGANITNVNFTATSAPNTWTISGTITPASLGSGTTVTLSGAGSATTTADGSGNYSFTGRANGAYTVTPTKASTTFAPVSAPVTVNGANVTGVNFAASSGGGGGTPTTWTISGTIAPAMLGAGATVTLSGAGSGTTTADGSGNYSFTGRANGAYTVTPTKASTTFAPVSAPVTVNGANATGVNFTASSTATVFFFDDFNGSSLGSAWKVIERMGPLVQDENVCNTADSVTVSGGNLVITTSATPTTCGDAVTPPSLQAYKSGSIQWNTLNFMYGVVEIRAKFPPQNTGTWPALWLLGSNCQAANIVNGSEAVPFMGCPAQGNSAYREIDMVECDARSWCHLVVAQGSAGWSSMCAFPVDANFHIFTLMWNAQRVSLAIDGAATGCQFNNTSLNGNMFLIIQTQTTTAAGVGGMPNNANLPTTLQVDYVRVTQP